jgi:hypothetical protein
MDQASRNRIARQVRKDIRDHEGEIARLREILAYVGDPIAGPSTNGRKRRGGRGPSKGPTVRTYILEAFGHYPKASYLTVAEIYDAAVTSGWTTDSQEPKTIIRTNLRRMVENGDLVVSNDGEYALAHKV